METVADSKNYELAYHLTSDLEESAVPAQAAELGELITRSGGVVLQAREPKRQHLSYPLRQKRYSYFGAITFSAAPETVEKLTAQLKLQTTLLRHLLTVKPYDDRALRVLSAERPRPKLKTHEPSVAKPTAPVVKPEQMEKEIEEVLEKI